MKKYSILQHTADIGLSVNGKTLKEVFANAAFGFVELLGAKGNSGKPLKKHLHLKALDSVSLLVAFLNELNYISTVKKAVVEKVVINKVGKTMLTAELYGLKSVENISFLREIKAATYHNLAIIKTKYGLNTKILLDV